VDKLNEEALAAAKAGNYDEAVAKFSQVIVSTPRIPEKSVVYGLRADCYTHQGQFDKAWDDLTQAIALDPKNAHAYYLQGFILDERHNPRDAIVAYSKAIELDPKDTDSLYNRGVAFSVAGAMDSAIKDYSRVVEVDAKYASAYANRGAAYAAQGKLDAALADLTKAVTLDPQEYKAFGNRAKIHMVRREYAEAIKDCDALLRLVQNDEYIRIRAEAQAKLK
jgi:tetratricopeptide (TPR) repeat protein